MTYHLSSESTRSSQGLWITAVCVLILLSLGTWQLYRLTWKTELIAQIQHSLKSDPTQGSVDLSPHPFQRVVLQGTLLHNFEFHWVSKTLDGQLGYHLITPLVTEQGMWVLVDRGFVPKAYENKDVQRPTEPLSITGIARSASDRSYFTPESNMANRQIYHVDPFEISQALGHSLAPYYIIQDPQEGSTFPRPIPLAGHLKNNHLMYAVTWYLLAAICLLIYFLSLRKSHISHLSS